MFITFNLADVLILDNEILLTIPVVFDIAVKILNNRIVS